MPSTVYRGDLAEVTMGRETGLVITAGAWGGLDISVSTSGDVSTLTFSNAAAGTNGSSDVFTDNTCDYNNDPTIAMDSTAKLKVGMVVSGSGIPTGATVASIDTNGTHFELSDATTGGNVSNGTLTFHTGFSDMIFSDATTLKYPKGLLVGSALRIKSTSGTFADDDFIKGNVHTIVENGGSTIKVTPALKARDTFTDGTCDFNNDPTITMNSTASVRKGMGVKGNGIPIGAKVGSVNANGTTFELADAAGDPVSTTGGNVVDRTLTFSGSSDGDCLMISALGTPTIDVGMTYNASAAASDESVLTDQFVGLAATVTLPESKTEIFRSHVVGIGRDVAVQAPQKITNEGGSLETMMHSARWMYYALGNEAVKVPSGTTAVDLGLRVNSIGMGDSYISFSGTPSGTVPAVGDYLVVDDPLAVLTPYTDEPATEVVFPTGSETQFHSVQRNEVRRVAAIDTTTGYYRIYVDSPFNFDHANAGFTLSCDFNNGTTITTSSTTNVKVGMSVFATGIPTGATVTSIPTATTFVISAATTGGNVVGRSVTLSDVQVYSIAVADDNTNGSPHFETTDAAWGNIQNRQTRALFSMWRQPTFSLETSMRTRNVGSYSGESSANTPGGTADSQQLTRIYKGCKVKSWEMTADADAEVKLKVDFDALMCYTDTGRLEDSNKGDRYTAHRMFENTGATKANRKTSGIAPNTEKPFFFYNGTITAFNTTMAQVTKFKVSGNNNTQAIFAVGAQPLAESRNTAGQSLEQVPFGGSRNPSLNVEGKVEYECSMEVIVTDPLLWHEFRTNREHLYDEPITLHLVKNGAGAAREEVRVIIDDYIISEAPMQIPDDKSPIKSELVIMPKHVKVVAHDALLHC